MFECLSVRGLLAAALIAPPSAELLGALVGVDVRQLDPGLQVDLMVAWERAAAWVAACQLPVIAVVGDAAFAATSEAMKGSGCSEEMPFRAAHAEIGCALRLSEPGGQDRLAMAAMIAVELPEVQTALLSGDISYRHAVAIAETAQEIDDPADRQRVTCTVLPKARRQTVGDLRRRLRRLLLAINPKNAAERHAKAASERRLDWYALADGMAELRLVSTAAEVKAAFNTVDAFAGTVAKKDADGGWIPIDARRADALVALVAGASGGAASPGTPGIRPAASIYVTMDLATLLGLRDSPGELAGYGPIPAPHARALAADGKWRRLIHDPLTGALLDLGSTSYQPSAALERFIRARDARCSFPSCGQPAHRCEIDHTKPYRHGDPNTGTDRCNLGCLCKYHHDLKHHAGWQLRRDPVDHTATWTSATGHRYPVAHHDQRSIIMTRPAVLPDDSDIRWSDEILTDIDWDSIDWLDRDYVVAAAPTTTANAANAASTANTAAAPATVIATADEEEDEVCPF